jgi:hypothetical protein
MKIGLVGSRAFLDDMEKRKVLTPPGLELQRLARAFHSPLAITIPSLARRVEDNNTEHYLSVLNHKSCLRGCMK